VASQATWVAGRCRQTEGCGLLVLLTALAGKSKIHPITNHEGPEVEYRYRSTLSLTSALDWVGGQRHAPAALPPGKTRYPLHRRLACLLAYLLTYLLTHSLTNSLTHSIQHSP
jgi:hypothetical protein